jgi:hypothetical protein
MPIGNRIIILYRKDRVLFGDEAGFDVIVTKRAILHFQFSANIIGGKSGALLTELTGFNRFAAKL